MIEVINELSAASAALRASLDRYLGACSALQNCCMQGQSVPPGLSKHVTDELLYINSHETRIKQVKTAINLSRNCCADIVPIHTLPNEILGRIFHLLCDAKPCSFPSNFYTTNVSPSYLDLLLTVCSRWRQVAIGSRALWSHIDIPLYASFGERFFGRTEAYAARASSLDIHIVHEDQISDYQYDYGILVSFLESIATRIRSLRLVTKLSARGFQSFYISVLRTCFAYCTPGMLAELIIQDYGISAGGEFINASENLDSPRDVLPFPDLVPQTCLEDLWFPTQVLRIHGRCLPWTSKAYHGLVHLRLTSWSPNIITESQLVGILRASPALRTFHFGHILTDPQPEGASVDPVILKDIKLLIWNGAHSKDNKVGTFLRWVAPGSRPLQVSVRMPCTNEPIPCVDEIQKFFARSNVTKLHIKDWRTEYPPLARLLCKLPSLQALAINAHILGQPRRATPDPSELVLSSGCRFEKLYLLECFVELDELQRLVKRHSVQSLTLWGCEVYLNASSHRQDKACTWKKIREQLLPFCPVLKVVGPEKRSPIKKWDFL